MSIRIIRKALGLLIVDIVIIIGIFVLQFRTDSNIIEKIGNLQFNFSQQDKIIRDEVLDADNNLASKNSVIAVQNKFRMSYNGLNLFFDEQNPVKIRKNQISDSSDEIGTIKLISWTKKDTLTYMLNFTDGVALTFELAADTPNASLAVVADMPVGIANVIIPYSYSSNMRIQQGEGNRVLLLGKKAIWEMSGFGYENQYLTLSKKDYVATYSVYEESKKFSFESIIDLPIADVEVYNKNIQNFKNNLIASFKSNTAESNLSEQVVVSYIAAQAENGNYTQAIEDIPANLKKSKQRTYLSAPYLNNLSDMNVILEKTVADYDKKLEEYASSGSLDIYTIHNIAMFMCIHKNSKTILKVLQNAAQADISNVSLAQATGILQVYADLVDLDSTYAQYLAPVLEQCVARITESCSFDNNVLTISENDTFLSVIQAIETGVAVMRYGYISGNTVLERAGYILVNSYLTENASFDLRTLANLYPVIAYNNWYYPHFKRIKTNDKNDVWAWTCAKDIKYEKAAETGISLTIDFPEGLTHYVILKGIPDFTNIYIYNMAFRTDPRFETYNSSGYVYKQNTETLLLKSRHKTQFEVVRMEYIEKPVVKPATVKEKTPEPVKAPVEATPASEEKQAVTPADVENKVLIGEENAE